jgi:hypothetical protein
MGFVESELERVTTKLQAGPLAADERGQLYAVQQALSWALNSVTFKSPYDMIVSASDTQGASEDCRAENGRSPFSDTPGYHAS